MSDYPKIIIDLDKIESNTNTIVNLAKKQGIKITGVTKATCGDPEVCKAMLKGGAISLADSRIQNVKKIKQNHPKTECMLLRTPMLSELNEVVKNADISLNSELKVIKKLSEKAIIRDKRHKVILMVEMGDLREGVPPEKINNLVEKTLSLDGINLYGIGMNLACFGGIVPTVEKVKEFSKLVETIEKTNNFKFKLISGGNSANIPLLLKKHDHGKINHLRIGEGILLGRETIERKPIPNTHQDAFILDAEIIELQKKPSLPQGTISQDAFGKKPSFEDRGIIKRAIVAVGRQDVIIEDLKPLNENIKILGGSSDHVILHINENNLKIGDTIKFNMKYGALVHLFTSPYVKKVYHN